MIGEELEFYFQCSTVFVCICFVSFPRFRVQRAGSTLFHLLCLIVPMSCRTCRFHLLCLIVPISCSTCRFHPVSSALFNCPDCVFHVQAPPCCIYFVSFPRLCVARAGSILFPERKPLPESTMRFSYQGKYVPPVPPIKMATPSIRIEGRSACPTVLLQ